MCRLLGITASEQTEFRILLRDAPRSLAVLSREHRDGWGIAVFDGPHDGWRIDKAISCASEDEQFHRLAVGSRGQVLVSHVRQKTVGNRTLPNTHPFQNGCWVFAHNGTIKEIPWLRGRVSQRRLDEVRGETDSELLFAWLLTQLDEAGIRDAPAGAETDRVIAAAVRTGRERSGLGSLTFLLSNGQTTYAHRSGRSLFLLERRPSDSVRQQREARDGTIIETPWSAERTAIFVASECITDEPWQNIDDGTLLRIDRKPLPQWRLLAA